MIDVLRVALEPPVLASKRVHTWGFNWQSDLKETGKKTYHLNKDIFLSSKEEKRILNIREGNLLP